jgi:hypothetical protein
MILRLDLARGDVRSEARPASHDMAAEERVSYVKIHFKPDCVAQ